MLDRLEEVVSHFEEAVKARDQRTARRWGDHGLCTIATYLVHLANVRGRLGVELLIIEISGTRAAGLHLVVSHLTAKQLDAGAPVVRFWKHEGDDIIEEPQSITLDLGRLGVLEAIGDEYRLKRYHQQVELREDLDTAEIDAGDALYGISLEARDEPTSTS